MLQGSDRRCNRSGWREGPEVGMRQRNLSESIRESLTASQSESLTASLAAQKGYGRTPAGVLHDPRLSPVAKVVYAELALWVFQGNIAKRGQRAIAEAINVRQMSVSAAIAQLTACGHIREANQEMLRLGMITEAQAKHSRGVYELLSPLFGSKQGSGIDKVVSSPRGDRRIVAAGEDQRKRA